MRQTDHKDEKRLTSASANLFLSHECKSKGGYNYEKRIYEALNTGSQTETDNDDLHQSCPPLPLSRPIRLCSWPARGWRAADGITDRIAA